MKCPSCQFVCSPLRDICPRCFIDLRAFKKGSGLPVTNQAASYEELLLKAGVKAKSKKAPKAPQPPRQSLFSGFKKLFAKKEKGKEQAAVPPQKFPLAPEKNEPVFQENPSPEKQPAPPSSMPAPAPAKDVSRAAHPGDEIQSAVPPIKIPEPAKQVAAPPVEKKRAPVPPRETAVIPETPVAAAVVQKKAEPVPSAPQKKVPALQAPFQEKPPAALPVQIPSAVKDVSPAVHPEVEVQSEVRQIEIPSPPVQIAAQPAEEKPVPAPLQEPAAFIPQKPAAVPVVEEKTETVVSSAAEKTPEQLTEALPAQEKPKPVPPPSENLSQHAPEVLDFSSAGEGDLASLIDKMLGESELKIELVKEKPAEEKTGKVASPGKPAERPAAAPKEAVQASPPAQKLDHIKFAEDYFEAIPIIEADDETAAFFSASWLDSRKGEESIEFSAELFALQRPSAEMEVFFDLALEAIENPEAEKKYVSTTAKVPASTESAALKKQLAAYEQSIAAMRPSLAGSTGRARKEEEEIPLPPPPEPAGTWVHLKTFIVDGFAVSIISALISIVALWFENPDLPLAVIGDTNLDQYDLIYFAGCFLAAFPLISIFYPLYSVLTRGSTRGMQATGLLILEERGLPPSKSNVAVRAICFPMSALFFGWVPMLFGKRSLHDRLARTMVTTMD